MAYQTRSRDPLLETHMQEAIRKRGRELIGLAMVAMSILFAAMLWSYSCGTVVPLLECSCDTTLVVLVLWY